MTTTTTTTTTPPNINFHQAIADKLTYFLHTEKIPNIIFHGPSGAGKRTLVHNFIAEIYQGNKDHIKNYVMNVNCAHGKGIRFVREDLKFFAKTHINIKGPGHFKTVVLSNADKLTIDAQSALRRCIELFSRNTRFFIIVEDKYKLLKPILSRLCEIFVAEPLINGKRTNLHMYTLQQKFGADLMGNKKRLGWLKKKLTKPTEITNYAKLLDLVIVLYERSYSGLDLIHYIENSDMELKRKYHLLLVFHKIKTEFRNEKLFMLFILHFFFLRSELDLENISFM